MSGYEIFQNTMLRHMGVMLVRATRALAEALPSGARTEDEDRIARDYDNLIVMLEDA